MSLVQPDLFGEWDARQARDRIAAQPATCPCCGTTEPNVHLLYQNHGVEDDGIVHGYPQGEHPIYRDRCVAQDLVSNHITFAVRRSDDDNLARSVARGRELGLDTDAIIAQARDEMARRDGGGDR